MKPSPFIALCFAVIAVCACARSAQLDPAMEVNQIVEEKLEYGPECAAARLRARDSVPVPDLVPVVPKQMAMTLQDPSSIRRRGRTTIDFVVDSAGNADPARTRISSSINDPQYIRRIRASLKQFRFTPAHIGRCAVEGKYQLTYTI